MGVAPATFALPTFSASASPRVLRQMGQSQSSPPPSVNCWNSFSRGGQPLQASPSAPPGSPRRTARSGHGWEGREDDWFAEEGELDWLDDPRENPAAASGAQSRRRGQKGDAGGQRGRRAGPTGNSPRETPALIARRRRVLALLI